MIFRYIAQHYHYYNNKPLQVKVPGAPTLMVMLPSPSSYSYVIDKE